MRFHCLLLASFCCAVFSSVSETTSTLHASPSIVEALAANPDECSSVVSSDDFEVNAARGVIFNSLSAEEIDDVVTWMLTSSGLGLTAYDDAKLYKDSYITYVYLSEPEKTSALNYLETGTNKPAREAHVHVNLGGADSPCMREYTVGPLPTGPETTLKARSFGGITDIPFNARPTDTKEYDHLDRLILKVMGEIDDEMRDSYGTNYYSECPDDFCLTYSDTSPRGPARDITFWFLFDVVGFFANPVGFYLTFNVGSMKKSNHHLKLIVYNGQSFDSVAEFKEAYQNGKLKKMSNRPLANVLKNNAHGIEWASLVKAPYENGIKGGRRGKHTRLNSNIVAPEVQEPGGKRFVVQNNHVEYLGWSFNFGHTPISGLKLYNIRYRGAQVAYEIGLSEAAAIYSGIVDIVQATTIYGDTAWGLGASASEMVLGIDCPSTGMLFDVSYLYDAGEATVSKNTICVFEHAGQSPLRRHSNGDSYGGLVTNSLVVRIVLPVYNYDYVFDHIFHINGGIELKGSTSGYLQSTFYSPEMDGEIDSFGQRIGQFTAGTTHDHVLNFKIDMDVGGTVNSLVKTTLEAVKANPADLNGKRYKLSNLAVADDYMTKIARHNTVKHESGFTMMPTEPMQFAVVSHNKNNWGARRGYKLKINGQIHNVVANTKSLRAYSFSKHTFAATVRHEDENTVSSIYDQSDTTGTIFEASNHGVARPLVDMDRYLSNKESMASSDLVLWVNVGVHHLTHAEDIPVTTTNGNQVEIFLLPHNLFGYDDSMDLGNSVYVSETGGEVDNFDLKDSADDLCSMTYSPLGEGYQQE